MAKFGMDLAKFRKISSSDKKTTLKHEDGHFLVISHKHVGPGIKKALDGLKMVERPSKAQSNSSLDQSKMAKGGKVPEPKEKKPTYSEQPASKDPGKMRSGVRPQDMYPEKYDENGRRQYAEGTDEPVQPLEIEKLEGPDQPAPGGGAPVNFSLPPDRGEAPADAPPPPTEVQPQAAAPQDLQKQSSEGSSSEPLPPAPAPEPLPAAAQTKAAAGPTISQELLKGRNDWAEDLVNQHVTPKTYQSLYADQSTLGKIGTMFGLMLSGAGSGLSHQPNALIKMMDNQIDRDLEAQKTSKANAQNFYKLHLEQEMNKAQIDLAGKQGKLTEAQIQGAYQDAKIKAITATKLNMQTTAYQHILELSKMLPPGQTKAKAEATAGQLGQMIDANQTQAAANAETTINNAKQARGAPESEEDFQKTNEGLTMLGGDTPGMSELANYRQAHHIPGEAGQSSRPVSEGKQDQIQAMTVLDNKGKDVLDYAKAHRGTWNPQTRAVAAQKIEEMKNFYNDSIKGGALTQGRLGWYDEQFAKHPTDILAHLMGSTAKLQEMVDSNSKRRELALKGLGFDGGNPQASAQPAAQTGTYKGKPVVSMDGGKSWKFK